MFDGQFSFRIDLRIGADVCGETALLASIEGKRGQPVPQPPYPLESGLWGHPTLINNVETFASKPKGRRETVIGRAEGHRGGARLAPGRSGFCLNNPGASRPTAIISTTWTWDSCSFAV
jgi:hypothetical protein